jgi:hypothetical protein
MISRPLLLALCLGFACAAAAPVAVCQSDQGQNQASEQVMMPTESAAKAKQILAEIIKARGGDAYLNVKDFTCDARVSGFDHNGQLTGFSKQVEYIMPPAKERDENLPKRNIISINSGDKGWTLDRGGVSPMSITELAAYQESVKTDFDNILRVRIHEPGMIFRYAGIDIVDYNEAEWVELVDSENRTFRIASNRNSHLPIRMTVDTRDANTRMRSTQTFYFSNFHPLQGIQTPFQTTSDRNGVKYQQVFYDKCEYNTGMTPDFFSEQSLQDRWQKIAPKNNKSKDDSDSKSKN